MYRKIASSNTSRLEAHVGLFRLLMKLVSCLSYLGPKQNKLHISRLLWDKIEFYRGLKMTSGIFTFFILLPNLKYILHTMKLV